MSLNEYPSTFGDSETELSYEDTSSEDEALSQVLPDKTKPRHVLKAKGKDRQMSFRFKIGERKMIKAPTIGRFMKLPEEFKLLMGIAQVNDSLYSFFTKESQRRNFVLALLNKGVEDERKMIKPEGLDTKFQEAAKLGHLAVIEGWPELTEAGQDYLWDNQSMLHSLKEPNATQPK